MTAKSLKKQQQDSHHHTIIQQQKKRFAATDLFIQRRWLTRKNPENDWLCSAALLNIAPKNGRKEQRCGSGYFAWNEFKQNKRQLHFLIILIIIPKRRLFFIDNSFHVFCLDVFSICPFVFGSTSITSVFFLFPFSYFVCQELSFEH